MIERTLTAVGKSNSWHGASSPSGDPYQRSRGWDRASTRFGGMPASQWQEPEGQPEDRTRVTGTYEIDRLAAGQRGPARRELICRRACYHRVTAGSAKR
ncbi:MAG: hypothetical protein EOP13_08880 [Pseudomonas sp.]|nr:MAG: hypothetical protein EOP13_08880 [Pseudomonas sp.]